MTFIRSETFDTYTNLSKIRDCPDGSTLFSASKKTGSNKFIIRVRDEKNATLNTKNSNEKIALTKPAKLNPYVYPIHSVFSHEGKNYTVYRYFGNTFSVEDVDKGNEEEEEEGNAKALITQFFIYLRRAAKLNCFPIENSPIENMTFYDGRISSLGFDTVIPTLNGSKEGITSDVITIAKNDIGLKSDYIEAASFIHYVFTGKSAITPNGLKILEDEIDNEDVVNLIKECTADKSSEQFQTEKYNPFKSEYLHHQPKVEIESKSFSIDALTFSWEEGYTISVGDVEISIDPGESSVTVTSGDNEINFNSEGVEIKGEYEGTKGTNINTVTINAEGLRMGGEKAWLNIQEDGLFTGPSVSGSPIHSPELKITAEGLNYEGDNDAKLTIGENFEYSPLDLFKVKFSPFSVNSDGLSLTLGSDNLQVDLMTETLVTINKKPSLNISSCGCLISMNEGSPISISIGAAVVFEFTGSSLQMTMSGVDIIFEDGNLKVDNDVVAMSIGKAGAHFSTYGVPFDMKAYKDKLTFPKFEFPEIAEKIKDLLPKIPGIPGIPKPGGIPDLGGCCSIF